MYVLNLGVGRSADLADAAGKVIGRVTVVKGAGNRLKALFTLPAGFQVKPARPAKAGRP